MDSDNHNEIAKRAVNSPWRRLDRKPRGAGPLWRGGWRWANSKWAVDMAFFGGELVAQIVWWPRGLTPARLRAGAYRSVMRALQAESKWVLR